MGTMTFDEFVSMLSPEEIEYMVTGDGLYSAYITYKSTAGQEAEAEMSCAGGMLHDEFLRNNAGTVGSL